MLEIISYIIPYIVSC